MAGERMRDKKKQQGGKGRKIAKWQRDVTVKRLVCDGGEKKKKRRHVLSKRREGNGLLGWCLKMDG